MTKLKSIGSHVLLWVIRLVPVALVILAIWLPSLISVDIRAIIGWIALTVGGIAAVVVLVMWTLAGAMRS